MIIDTAHNEQASEIEELREQLADAQHNKKLLSLRLQSLTHGYEQELKRARESLSEERAKVCQEVATQKSSEAVKVKEDIKREVELALTTSPFLDEAQYCNLKSANPASLSTQDFVRVRSGVCL